MRATLVLLVNQWQYRTVEWSSKVANVLLRPPPADNGVAYCLTAPSHFVLPDLPKVVTQDARSDFLFEVGSAQRITTIAACRYTRETLLDSCFPDSSKYLIVGGNDKSSDSLSTAEAAKLLRTTVKGDIWAVANPNDPKSIENVKEKIEAGVSGFITQPILSTHGMEILDSYSRPPGVAIVAGLAFPTSAKNLQFWCKLLGQPELSDDPLFQAHLAFFSQPYHTSSWAWIGKELTNLQLQTNIDGIHCMPLGNMEDLSTFFRVSDSFLHQDDDNQ